MEIGVASEYQSKGIGKKLLGTLFNVASELGCCEA